jgi:riboflavin-specific deaminase-like protein
MRSDSWSGVPELFRASAAPLPPPWNELFGPLRCGTVDELVVVGQAGQSLDGRIALPAGHPNTVNGPAGLDHLHRLRALVDAVIVGTGTVLADDPQLTVRRVAGPHPARVVIDPRARLSVGLRVFARDGVRRLAIVAEGVRCALPSDIEIVGLPSADGDIAPAGILAALAERGLRRILIEGGAKTLSRFLAAGCLDRLHIVVAPLIVGSGPSAFNVAGSACGQLVRPRTRAHPLGDEVLFDCDLSAQRAPIGRANRST